MGVFGSRKVQYEIGLCDHGLFALQMVIQGYFNAYKVKGFSVCAK